MVNDSCTCACALARHRSGVEHDATRGVHPDDITVEEASAIIGISVGAA